MTSMTSRLEAFSWIALSAWVMAKVALFLTEVHFRFGSWWPANPAPAPFAIFFILPQVLDLAVLIGFWLIFTALRSGGGRFWWRWWVGAIPVALFAWGLIDSALWTLGQERIFNATAHPWANEFLMLLAIPIMWGLAARGRR
jgi:hypothetical protein